MAKDKKKAIRRRFVDNYLNKMIEALGKIDEKTLDLVVDSVIGVYKANKSIFLIGNGGSASLASHLAADIGKNTIVNYKDPFAKRVKIHSLCDNVAWITAVSNDISFDDVFVEQLKNLANEGDLLIIISGSGNSTNIIKAVMFANRLKMKTVGILGFDGGFAKELLDISLVVDSSDYGIVESVHSYIHHYIVEALKNRMIVKLK